MTTSIDQQVNLLELIQALSSVKDPKGKSPLSTELTELLDEHLHHVHLPPTLHTSAAEAFQLAFEAWGGIPRLLLFADRYPGAFLKLYARLLLPTIAPILPQQATSATSQDWPPWLTARRLAYQEAGSPDQPDPEDPNV